MSAGDWESRPHPVWVAWGIERLQAHANDNEGRP